MLTLLGHHPVVSPPGDLADDFGPEIQTGLLLPSLIAFRLRGDRLVRGDGLRSRLRFEAG